MEKRRPTEEEFFRTAIDKWCEHYPRCADRDELEIDDNAKFSLDTEEKQGCWVQAWVWVYDSEVPGYENAEEEAEEEKRG